MPDGQSVNDALSTNPAALTRLTSRVLEGSISALLAGGTFTNSATSNGSLKTNVGLMPTGAIGVPIRSLPITVAIGIAPEAVSRAAWDYVDPPGGLGGKASFGNTSKTSELVALRTSFGVGYEINSRLSLGATVGWIYNSNVFQAPYIFQTNPVLAGLKTGLDLRTSGHAIDQSFGILYRASRRVSWGASYHTASTVQSRGDANGNAQQQFSSLGLPFRSDFHYGAQVETRLPRSVATHADWFANSRTRLGVQATWVSWADAFDKLRVTLRDGNNADINAFTGSTTLTDSVPLSWKNQWVTRVGVERGIREYGSLRAGYSHATNPVPSSTLTPLTASIFGNSISAGYGYRRGHYSFDAAYSYYPRSSESVGKSNLLTGEFDNSQVSVLLHTVTVSAGYRF